MRNQNHSLIVKGLLPLAACAALSGCVDDKYDLKDIDTTSRVTVNNLTVPVPLGEIKVDNLVNLDDNENISKIIINGQEAYAIEKGGNINSSEFSIAAIHVNAPSIPSTITPITLPFDISASTSIDPFDVNIPLTAEETYSININNIDKALVKLDNISTSSPVAIQVSLSVPQQIASAGNNISFRDIAIQLPWGFITDNASYNRHDGYYYISELPVGANGKASFDIYATGMDLLDKGVPVGGSLAISGNVGFKSGYIHFDLQNVNIPKDFNITVDYKISSFDISSFSGDIDYHMDNINIAPISLSGLPDFLDSPETEIRIANPQILVDISNPVARYGLTGSGKIKLTSNFKNGGKTEAQSDNFYLWYDQSLLSFGEYENGYDYIEFKKLGDILACNPADGLPSSISVNLEDLRFYGHATDFPLGSDFGNARGDYKFSAPLGFADGSKVVYETVENGWGSDDLDDVNITLLRVTAHCETNLPVGVQLWVTPVDKNGNDIVVKEPSPLKVSAMANGSEISIALEGANGPIHGFDGVRFRAVISQNSNFQGMTLGPDLFIKLTDVRATVDGYYETDF